MLQVVQLNGTTTELVVEDCGQNPVGHTVQDPTTQLRGVNLTRVIVASRPFVDGVDDNPYGTQALGPIPAPPAPPVHPPTAPVPYGRYVCTLNQTTTIVAVDTAVDPVGHTVQSPSDGNRTFIVTQARPYDASLDDTAAYDVVTLGPVA